MFTAENIITIQGIQHFITNVQSTTNNWGTTRITSTSKSLIDHILCNNQDNIVQSGTISTGLSDPFLIFCTRKATRGVFNTHKTVNIRSLKHYLKDDFILKLKNADWNVFHNSTCINTAWTHFKTIFCHV